MKIIVILSCVMCLSSITEAGITSNAIKEAIEETIDFIVTHGSKQPRKEIVKKLTKAVKVYGDDCIPFLKKMGDSGFDILENADKKAPDIIKFYQKRGDDAIWIISKPKKLAIFIKHGDSAAEALLKHIDIADDIIVKYDQPAVGALNRISREEAQKLGIMVANGSLDAIPHHQKLLIVIRDYGDEAMDFIWKHKVKLTTAAIVLSFLDDPEPYIKGINPLPLLSAKSSSPEGIGTRGEGTITAFIFSFIVASICLGYWKFKK